MPQKSNKDIKKEIKQITDVVDIDQLNKVIGQSGMFSDLVISKKTLTNIAEWALDGKSQFEIAHNLELTPNEWAYLLKICPAIALVMQHSTAYADIIVAGTLFQTAIGGKVIKKKIPMKVKDYDIDSKGRSIVVGEHYEMVEYEEITEPNPLLLKYLAEHKMSEQFGKEKKDNSLEHRGIIDNMTDEERKIIEEMSVK